MSEHINTSQWMKFFSRKATENEKLLILRHVAECEACRNMMDKVKDFRFALERQQKAKSEQMIFENEGMEYRAVAGIHPESVTEAVGGSLSVELKQTETGYVFVEDTLEADGIGNKYAMNCSDDCCELVDDGEELFIRITDNRIIVRMEDSTVGGYMRILSAQSDVLEEKRLSEMTLPLPVSGSCAFQIVFEEE